MSKAIYGKILSTFWLIVFILSSCDHNKKVDLYQVDENKYLHDIGYIDSTKALLNEGFKICNKERIYQYYNPRAASYSKGKNGLKKFILENYENKGYQDSGYLTIRFVINCEGQAGRYVIHENDLDLIPKKFDPKLVEHLFDLTVQLKKWNPNIIHGKPSDSYMFLTYRIRNGEILEILP